METDGAAFRQQKLSAFQLQSEYLEALHRIALGLMRRRDLDSLLEEITVRAAGLLHTPNAFLYILADDGETMEMKVGVGHHRSQLGARRRPGEGFVGKVWQEGAIAAEQRVWQTGPGGEGATGVAGTIVGVPLWSDRQVIGVLGFNIMAENYLPGEEEKALLQRFAELSSIAVGNARLYAKLQNELAERARVEELLRRQNRHLELLHMLSVRLMTRFEAQELLANILDGACELVETPHGYFYLAAPGASRMEVKVARGFYRGVIGKQLKPGEEMSGRIWQSGQSFVTDDYSTEPGRNPDPGHDAVRAWIGIPLKRGEEVLGVFCLARIATDRTFSAEETVILKQFAELASLALSNARLYEALEGELAERTRAEAALRESEASYRTLAENLPGIVYRVFLRENGRVRFFNAMLQAITGYRPEELTGGGLCPLGGIVAAADRERVEAACQGAIDDNRPFEVEYGITRKDGGARTVIERARPVSGADGPPLYVEGVIMDITAQKSVQDKLLFISTRDGLTSLYNRAYFEAELDRRENAGDGPVGIIVCDINGLKLINDAMGHAVGDIMLVAAAKILKDAFRREDIVARIGGDEYAVLMPDATDRAVEAACRRVRDAIEAYNDTQTGVYLSLSLGHAVGRRCGESIRALLREADNNMYREKLSQSHGTRSAIVQTAIKLLEERDFFADEHADKIGRLALRLARGLGLPEASVAAMRLLAKYHDIGKVGVPDHILRKPGPLTAEERAEVRRHCEIGYRIAQSSSELLPVAEWILKHHEWWNGGGYPVGLSGDQIPRECRILAVVEAYDAMTSDRPYRKAMTHDEAVAEIGRCAGTQFDPAIVRVFLSQLGRCGVSGRRR
ncbi:HD domain-containing phosphohydrolase [Anaeroselena agilis]|uniref:Diguanylate cyclase n=1 Tax=Anaeroselena agilis TaxID=3063788 RepID=A0ABU3NZ72_9FIRM|nr:diguanylate cyclase [Selenomonadales bacterium 4137-cl]